jgi:hypothetical protein
VRPRGVIVGFVHGSMLAFREDHHLLSYT